MQKIRYRSKVSCSGKSRMGQKIYLDTNLFAAKLRARYDLATPDCIHIATAISEKVDIFYTADKGIKKVKEVKIEVFLGKI